MSSNQPGFIRAEMEQPTICNVIGTAKLGRKFDLITLRDKLGIGSYMPRKFPSLVVPMKHPQCKITMFRTGKVVCLGCRTEADCLQAVKNLMYRLRIIGCKCKAGVRDFRIRNIVASFSCGNQIDLAAIYNEHILEAMYNPEIFPGLTCKLNWPPITFLIFTSGKIVITGACTIDELKTAYMEIVPIIEKYKYVNTSVLYKNEDF